jgi:hypothetical protein
MYGTDIEQRKELKKKPVLTKNLTLQQKIKQRLQLDFIKL